MQNCHTLHTKWYSLSRWVIASISVPQTTKSTVALKEHTLWWGWLWHHHTDDRCINTSYTLKHYCKDFTMDELIINITAHHRKICVHLTVEKTLSFWWKPPDQTVKKWDNSTEARWLGETTEPKESMSSTREGVHPQRVFWEYLKPVQESWRAMKV